ncbi:hypothetical protein [Coleofasciculus sp.]|uniref:hypothetical protein n=1 Tax=Coleofasciculus sp. TaxID=3100458 RepID=UPI003A13FB33
MIIGNLDPWADTFPRGLIPEILEMVVSEWASFPQPNSNDHEVPITRRFRLVLIQSKNIKKLPVRIDREIPEDNFETGEEVGRIDLRFTHGYREDVYFTFECKRLNIIRKDNQRESLATQYVEEGMMRFITSQYASGLLNGGMIGYIMNGDIKTALQAVNRGVESRCQELRINPPSGLCTSSLIPTNTQVKETLHNLESRKLTIHHVFLPVQ